MGLDLALLKVHFEGPMKEPLEQMEIDDSEVKPDDTVYSCGYGFFRHGMMQIPSIYKGSILRVVREEEDGKEGKPLLIMHTARTYNG